MTGVPFNVLCAVTLARERLFPLGAIAGDVIGSVHEHAGTKTTDFPLFTPASRFTDDSVLTAAVAEVLASGGDYADSLQRWARAYPRAGYGGAFRRWMWSEAAAPYGSFGNGSGMRASPVGWARTSLEEVLDEARRSAEVTHDHPEGIKGAQAVAAAVFLARTGSSKDEVRAAITTRFGYDLSRRLDDIRPQYTFDVTCQGSVPEALIAFLESSGWEDAVRKAVSLGGDADTLACMTGAVAEAFYGGVPPEIATEVVARLDDRIRAVIALFAQQFFR
jgi:ADP-ribosylglycohydrolase